jgi:VIT1/CCC1 family predicted Fe2+/Mn2+ transporter
MARVASIWVVSEPTSKPGATGERFRAVLEGATVREILMGAQDNLTNVLAVVLGVTIGVGRVDVVALAGLAAALAEAISMAGVLYTSTLAERDLDALRAAEARTRPRMGPLAAGTVTGIAALLAGVVPLIPFAFMPLGAAVVVSLVVSLTALFGLGMVTASVTRRSWLRNGIRLVVIAGVAAVAGAIVGVVLRVS